MQSIRDDLHANFDYIANISRLATNISGQPRQTVYLIDWRCTYGPITLSKHPLISDNVEIDTWQATGTFYDKTQIPVRGDRLENVRYYRTGLLVVDKMSVMDIHHHPEANVYTLILRESSPN